MKINTANDKFIKIEQGYVKVAYGTHTVTLPEDSLWTLVEMFELDYTLKHLSPSYSILEVYGEQDVLEIDLIRGLQ